MALEGAQEVGAQGGQHHQPAGCVLHRLAQEGQEGIPADALICC